MNKRSILAGAVALGLATFGSGNAARAEAGDTAAATPEVILVVGAAGEPQYGEAFNRWADRWEEAVKRADASLIRIGPAADDSPEDHNSAKSKTEVDDAEPTDREQLRRALAEITTDGSPPVWLVMMGHGTFTQGVARFNLRGPDVSADELAGWVGEIDRPLVVVAAFSSSGPFINALSAENRVIVTATRSGSEQNYSRFGDYLSRAIGDPAADIDHDGEVSILEAFLYAAAGVREFYRSAGRLLTENALIDDNGDGLGTPATAFRGIRPITQAEGAGKSLDGAFAAGISLIPAADAPPFTEEQLARRSELEAELRQINTRYGDAEDREYRDAAFPLLVQLARLYAAVEANTVASESAEDADSLNENAAEDEP